MSNKNNYSNNKEKKAYEPEKTTQAQQKVKESVEIEKEKNTAEVSVKEEPKAKAAKQLATVILITRDGCIAKLMNRDTNIRFYGSEYLSKKIGEVVEVIEL